MMSSLARSLNTWREGRGLSSSARVEGPKEDIALFGLDIVEGKDGRLPCEGAVL